MVERQTKQKAIIWEALKGLDHPTATEVFAFLHEEYPNISRSTVFRVLGGFASSGKALELKMAGDDVRYDFNVMRHYHAHCRKCGRVADVKVDGVMPEIVDSSAMGFDVEGYSVEFYGICSECKEK